MNEVLTRTARSVAGSSQRLRNSLAAVEIALSLVLLIGAGLTIRTLASLMSTDLGFRPDHLLIMRVTLPESKYANPQRIASFNRRLLEGLRQVVGVQGAALTNSLPMKSVNQSSFSIPGRTYPPGSLPVANWGRSSDAYFETLGMRLIRGRTFTRQNQTRMSRTSPWSIRNLSGLIFRTKIRWASRSRSETKRVDRRSID